MTMERRQRAISTAIEAVKRYEDYQIMVVFVIEEFDHKEEGLWGCIVRHKDDTNTATIVHPNQNTRLYFTIGECLFWVWECLPSRCSRVRAQ